MRENKDASWFDCLENSNALSISPDKFKISSLIETAKARIAFTEKIVLSEESARFIFEDYYSSAIEMIHALMLFDGFRAENHICTGFYLRDVMKRDDLFRIFDYCRIKRNGIVYYGKKMELEIAKDVMDKIKRLIGEIELENKKRLSK